MTVNKAFYKFMDGSFRRSITCRKGKSRTKINIDSNKAKHSSFHGGSCPMSWPYTSLLAGHSVEWLLHLGLRASLCCWCIWHSVAAVARSVLVSGNLSCWAHVKPPSLPPQPIEQWQEWLKEADHQKGSTYQLDYWIPPGLKPSFDEYLQWDTSIFTSLERSVHILLFQMSFSPIYQSCFSQVTDNPANPLTTALITSHQSVNKHTSGHFPFQTKCMTLCTTQSSAHSEGFPLSVSFRVVPKRNCNVAAVLFWPMPT